MVWNSWKAANVGFSEYKMATLKTLEKVQSGSFDLTAYEPNAVMPYYYGTKGAAKPEAVPCAINSVDVGIAIGSACAMASDMRVDTRVMFSAGLAAQRLHFLGEKAKCVMAIPVSASSKNPFFDRKPHEAK